MSVPKIPFEAGIPLPDNLSKLDTRQLYHGVTKSGYAFTVQVSRDGGGELWSWAIQPWGGHGCGAKSQFLAWMRGANKVPVEVSGTGKHPDLQVSNVRRDAASDLLGNGLFRFMENPE